MSTEPLDPIAAMLRSWWLIAAALVAGAVALGLIAYLQPLSWTATATVQYRPGDPVASLTGGGSGVSGTDADRLLNSQQDILLGDAVITPAAASLAMPGAQLRRALELRRRDGSDILTLSATAGSPEAAARLASIVTTTYVEVGRAEGEQALSARAKALGTTIVEVSAAAATLPPAVEGVPDDPRRASYVTQLEALEQQQQQLIIAARLYPGKITVLRMPEIPSAPSSPGALEGGIVGASLGLVLGMIVAIGRGARSRSRSRRRPVPAQVPWDLTAFEARAPAAPR